MWNGWKALCDEISFSRQKRVRKDSFQRVRNNDGVPNSGQGVKKRAAVYLFQFVHVQFHFAGIHNLYLLHCCFLYFCRRLSRWHICRNGSGWSGSDIRVIPEWYRSDIRLIPEWYRTDIQCILSDIVFCDIVMLTKSSSGNFFVWKAGGFSWCTQFLVHSNVQFFWKQELLPERTW